jgi:hypothetical protein
MVPQLLYPIINRWSQWVQGGSKEKTPAITHPQDKGLDPFGNEDVADVKYRTMTWW